LIEATFAWARSVKPTQPLTTCWHAEDLWDVVSFHDYGPPEPMQLARWVAERPALCTECIARGRGSRFDCVLPAFAEKGIGWYMWGLVKGRIQTYYPWGSKKGAPEPNPWHHDLLQPDGKPYHPDEIELIRKFPGQFHFPSAAAHTVWQSDYRGWKTLALSNGLVELQVAPQIGGRVMRYRLGGFDFFWVNSQLAGKQPPESGLASDGGWLNYGGEKLWPAPQGWDNAQQWPGPPDAVLDGSPHEGATVAKEGQAVIMLRSREDPRSGIRFSRTIRLFDGSTRVHIDATMTNIDDKPRRWGIWSVAQQNATNRSGDGYDKNLRVYCPINPKSKLPKGYRVLFGDPHNPSFQLDAKHDIMQVHYQRRIGKIALDSSAGWVATVHGTSGCVFVQRFRHDAVKAYPDDASVEIWLNGAGKFSAWGKVNELRDDPIATPAFIETELLSPLAALKPGEQYTFGYDWYAASIGGDYPVVDCNDMGVVCDPLTAKLIDGKLVLGGRFGLFCQATAAIAFEAAGKTVGGPVGRRNVSPLASLIFSRHEELPVPPPGADAISVRLYGADGRLLGELARAGLTQRAASIPPGT
jgi:hypothetical protein